ncbi:hypothetical protein AAFF_G00219300 [Aldrovandia affinis]|uniref:Peptidase S1 domain-containing protein n=1 Tax=Aldrovandia affinis TaxID=143900 RepID=A0AAD7W4Z3_9TELE|nr:hypothetical protein AAFF_G00219300 [Aldrovandia affinis]
MPTAASLVLLTALLPSLALTGQQESGIVNGREAKPHSRPYMVSVQEENQHICGGFLVSKSFVMTAAHCLTWVEVKLYHIHPGFNADTLDDDIMLLQLKNAVKESKKVKLIDLPKRDKDEKPKTVCSVAGWGANKTNGIASRRLMEANVTVVDRKVCRKIWGKKPITPRMMCAGGSADNRGFCRGDSGGPLVCKGTAVGVVSFNARNCDAPKKPNVYTQISKYLSWIKCIIGSTN